jgi:hypothetical protein
VCNMCCVGWHGRQMEHCRKTKRKIHGGRLGGCRSVGDPPVNSFLYA